jgi:hypothetical protein
LRGRTSGTPTLEQLEADVPVTVIAIAIAALPVVALLLAIATRMESALLGDPREERRSALLDTSPSTSTATITPTR